MSELDQSQANYLLNLEKVVVDNKYRRFPSIGGKLEVPLKSVNEREAFLLNIIRGKNCALKLPIKRVRGR